MHTSGSRNTCLAAFSSLHGRPPVAQDVHKDGSGTSVNVTLWMGSKANHRLGQGHHCGNPISVLPGLAANVKNISCSPYMVLPMGALG